MTFDFDKESIFTQQLEILDPGNCAIRCISGMYEYYLIIRTIFGRTYSFKYGPIIVDIGSVDGGFAFAYSVFDYKESKIQKEITKLLQDDKKNITEAEVITVEEALNSFPDIKKLILTIGEED